MNCSKGASFAVCVAAITGPYISYELRLGHEAACFEPPEPEDVERRIRLAGDGPGDDARDGGRDHEPVAAEAGGDEQAGALAHGPEHRLVIRGDVVDPADERRVRDHGEQRQEPVARG